LFYDITLLYLGKGKKDPLIDSKKPAVKVYKIRKKKVISMNIRM